VSLRSGSCLSASAEFSSQPGLSVVAFQYEYRELTVTFPNIQMLPVTFLIGTTDEVKRVTS
jgi:hypothetical protein